MKRLLALMLATLMCLGLLAGCSNGNTGLNDAKEYLDTVMKAGSENTPADYTVLNKVVIGKEEYTVSWSVDVTADVQIVVAEDGTVTVDVNDRAAADVAYVLTATIKDANGKTITATYNRKLPAFKELTWAEFAAAEDDTAVVVKGIITGIINTETKHELYLESTDGGYYVYNLAAEKMEGLEIGMEIRVLGIRDTYYGVNQIIEASVEIINATPAPVTPKDITQAVLDADNFKAEDLLKLQSTLVTIKGVTVIGQDSTNDTYFNFSIDGKLSYVRISGSANMLSEEDTATFKENVENNVGKSATATGIVSIYNNQIYLIPVTVDAYSEFAIVERTPAEQVAFEADLMEAPGTITEAGNITLSTAVKLYEDVVITWALGETTFATLSGNTLTVPTLPDDAQTITLTATLTSGEESTTKTFTVKINAAPTEVADMVSAPVAETLYKFYIKQYNTKQTLYFAGYDKGLTVTTDPSKAVDVGLEPVAGKDGEYYFYYMVGTAKNYIIVSDVNGKYEVSASRYNTGSNTYKYNEEFDMLVTTVTIADEEITYWFGTYNQNAKLGISSITYINASNYNASQFPAHFGTLIDVTTKTDAEKVEREKNDLTIKTEFDSMGGTVKLPAYGDLYAKVTITWTAESNAAVVIENGTLKAVPQAEDATVKVTATIKHGEVTETKEFTVTVEKKPATVEIISIEDALELADGTAVVVKGTVTKINTAWSDQYNNISVTISDGTGELYLYRLATKVEEGDVIVVTGKMATYNDARQVAAGATAEIAPKPLTVAQALELADGADVLVKGTVTKINTAWSDQYNNISVTISDGTNELYLYRLATKVEVGDVIVVTGKMATYNGARQVAAGATATIEGSGTVETPAPIEATITEALELADGTEVIVKGTVKKINTEWSDQHGNISVTISNGPSELYLYRLATKVELGDVITVTGTMATYNGARQVAAGATAVITPKVSIAEALELADGTEVIVKGTVTVINTAWSEQHGNMSVTISDGTNTLYLYRLASKVKVGDVITVTGTMATYNGARQIAAGAIAAIDLLATV